MKSCALKVQPIEIAWNEELPVFSSEPFLRAVGDEYGWLGGLAESGELRCILPYTIIHKAIFRMARFRVETIPVALDFQIDEEKAFLENVVEYFRSIGADMIIPATTNSIFRTYPEGAVAAPYASYVIDLQHPENKLWKNIDRIVRQNINTASRAGVIISDANDKLESGYELIRETFKRSKLPFMGFGSFKQFVDGLGNHGKTLVAESKGLAQSFAVFGYSRYCAYAIYAGNIPDQQPGANKLLYWEAMKQFQQMGVRAFDFVGARVSPKRGSKQEALGLLKKRFGARLTMGYIWKYALNPMKYRLYNLAARLRSGGDIVDAEKHKLRDKISGPI